MKTAVLAVQGKLLKELDMYGTLKEKIEQGMPVLATCAGLILLAEKLSNDEHVYFGTLPVCEKKCLWETAWKLSRRTGNERNRRSTHDLYTGALY